MKIVYCTHSVYNPGGMERVLLIKLAWLRENTPWDLLLVTTDQKDRPPFFPLPPGVRHIDLGINYSDDRSLSPLRKIRGYLRRRRLHRRRLGQLLSHERPDITVSLLPSESSFIPSLPDGSRKVLELHFSRPFRLQYQRTGILGLIDRWRSRADLRMVRRFDRFVVLTREDCGLWGNIPNILTIPNPAQPLTHRIADVASSRRVIAVGRLDRQKNFSLLIHAWALLKADGRFPGWKLDIFGQGHERQALIDLAASLGVAGSVSICPPVTDIASQYLRSAFLVSSSRYEGMPMVMLEAMSCGLPVVSTDYQCGPRDIIIQGRNGLIASGNSPAALADAIRRLMSDASLRSDMSAHALESMKRFNLDRIMSLWVNLFTSLSEK